MSRWNLNVHNVTFSINYYIILTWTWFSYKLLLPSNEIHFPTLNWNFCNWSALKRTITKLSKTIENYKFIERNRLKRNFYSMWCQMLHFCSYINTTPPPNIRMFRSIWVGLQHEYFWLNCTCTIYISGFL